jgi:hypothetical protein
MTLWLVVMTNPTEGREQEYNDWYSNEHLADVLAVEGFRAAQRFAFVESGLSKDAPKRYLAIYEVDEDARERAEELLLSTANTDAMPISRSMERGALTWWFQSITDRVESQPADTRAGGASA